MVRHDNGASQSIGVPLVSVIIPAYNAERFIGETISSVLNQTYSNLEILVVDDGSTDKTAEIVCQYIHDDRRIKLIQQANAGVAAARNHGIHISKGKFIAPLDADDIWNPENIEAQVVKFLSVGDEVGLVYSWAADIDESGKPTGDVHTSLIEGNVHTTLLLHDFVANASSLLVRRSCLQHIGGYDIRLRQLHGQGCEDWDLLQRIAERNEFRLVPRILVGYRRSVSSMSKNYSQMARSHGLIWKKIYCRYPRIPPFLERLSSSSFYLHLASESALNSNSSESLTWACKAFMHAPIPTLLNPGFYRISVIGLLKYFLQTSRLKLRLPSKTRQRNREKLPKQMLGMNYSTQRTWRTKPAGELLLHYFVSRLIGPADQWQ